MFKSISLHLQHNGCCQASGTFDIVFEQCSGHGTFSLFGHDMNSPDGESGESEEPEGSEFEDDLCQAWTMDAQAKGQDGKSKSNPIRAKSFAKNKGCIDKGKCKAQSMAKGGGFSKSKGKSNGKGKRPS